MLTNRHQTDARLEHLHACYSRDHPVLSHRNLLPLLYFQLSLPEHCNVLSSYREARWNPGSRLPGPHAHSAHQRPRSNTALMPGVSNRFPMTRNHSCPADQKSPVGKSKAFYKLLVYGLCDTRRSRPLVYTYYTTNTADDLSTFGELLKSSASQNIHEDQRRSPHRCYGRIIVYVVGLIRTLDTRCFMHCR